MSDTENKTIKLMRVAPFLLLIAFLFLSEFVKAQAAAYPFPQNRTYSYGFMQTYETAAASGTRANTWYTSWKSSWLENCGSGLYRVKDGGGNSYSEGIGYGMLMAAYAGDKTVFDGLWQYYKYNDNAASGVGLMHWCRNSCGGSGGAGSCGNNAATDGDLDAAMALIIANCQWPGTSSPHNYASDATALITLIKNDEFTDCSGRVIQKPGNVFGGCNCTNPSYFAPGYYRAFADFVPSQAAFWQDAADDAYWLLDQIDHATTGLVPAWTDASGGLTGGSGDCNGIAASGGGNRWEYQFDAARTPWRIATDYLWWGTPEAATWLSKVSGWVDGVGIGNIVAGYQTNGSPNVSYKNSAFTGAFALGAMASSQTHTNTFYNWWVNNSVTSGSVGSKLDDAPYFQNSLRTIYLFLASGNFWYPCTSAPPSSITVSVTSPTDGTVIGECDGPVTINASASTTNGSITKVEFFVDGVKIGEDNSSPYSYTWSNYTAGEHTIHVVAHNSAAETNNSSDVDVTVAPGIYQTSTAPTIDGTIDAIWGTANSILADNVITGTVSSGADLTGDFKVMWDNTRLYILADITDDARQNESADGYNDDGIEIYIDMGNDKSGAYGADDFQYQFEWNSITITESEHNAITGVSFDQANRTGGYVMEISIPWSTLGGVPSTGDPVGIDFHVNDDDNGGTRDGKKAWNATVDNVWQVPSLMGTMIFGTTNCTGCTSPNLGPDVSICGSANIVLNSQVATGGGKTYTWRRNGTIVAGPNTTATTYTATSAGTYEVTIDDNGCIRVDEIEITGILPTPVMSPAGSLNICAAPASYDFTVTNSASFPGGVTWQWSKGGSNLTGETTTSLTNVRTAGTYRITASITGCASTFDEETVTSSLPTPVDGCRANTGTVNLSITNPGLNGTNYNWYADASGGSPLAGGTGTTSFTTPSISTTTTYYVQDMSAVAATVGRTANTTALNNGGLANLGINFDAYDNFNILSVDVPIIYYSATSHTIEIEVQTPGGTMVASSGEVTVADNSGGSGYPKVVMATVNVNMTNIPGSSPTPISYKMVAVGGTAQLHRETGGTYNYATYINNPGAGNVVRLTSSIAYGANNTSSYEFFYNWQVTTGTPCDRLPVIATIGTCSSLPVGLMNFNGNALEDHTQLSWATSYELNNDRFEIEKSTNGVNFTVIGTLSGTGNSNGASVYSFADYEANTGVSYYRIAQYDFDGTVTYSNVINVHREEQGGFIQAIPNPFTNTSELVVVNGQNTSIQLTVTDLSGAERYSSNMHATNEKITLGEDLPKGVYIVQALVNNKIYTTRVVKF